MRPNLNAPLNAGGPAPAQAAVHGKETAKVDEFREESDFYYTKERLSYIGLIKNLGLLAIAVGIASITLSAIHVANHPLAFAIILLVASCIFFLGAIFAVYWAVKATKAFKASHDLFQPQIKEETSRFVFILSLLLAAVSAFILTHLYVESEYSPDYATAQNSTTDTWDEAYSGRTLTGLNSYFRKHFIIQGAFFGFFFFYNLLTARAAFNCLKFGNQAMSHLVFLGNFLLLGFSLCVIFFADYAFEYSDYPQLRDHFPVWNIRGLYFVAIALTAVSVTGFLVDHKSWRVGFFVLAFILLVLMALLASFTGFAYRHTRQTYEYYKGVADQGTCRERMDIVAGAELEGYGCPYKYQSLDYCAVADRITQWEDEAATYESHDEADQRTSGTAPAQRTTTTTTPTGTTTTTTDDGTTTTTTDGTTTTTNPEEGTTTTATDDGTTTTTTDDGTTTTATDDGTTTTTNPEDGTTTTATDDGTTTTTNDDGSVTTTNADGSSTTTYPDGSTTTTATDGTTTTTATDGTITTTNPDGSSTVTNPDGSTTTTAADGTVTTTDAPEIMFAQDLTVYYCPNTQCCGLQGQLYSKHLIQLSAFGLLATLAAGLVSIGCYYFWYVTWVDTARDKRRDFIWLGLMALSVLVFVILFFSLDRSYIEEQLDDNGQRQLL